MIDDKTGRRFGRLVATSRAPNAKSGVAWHCRCDCGALRVVLGTNLQEGRTKSCGCLNVETVKLAKHGHDRKGQRSPTYRTWVSMISRCHDQNVKSFAGYGAKGITVCQRWRSCFEHFLADMGERPAGCTIDRIDNDRGYFPGNCRWLDAFGQARNKRNTVMVTIADGSRIPLWDAAIAAGLKPMTVHARRARGVPESRWLEPLARKARAA